jgi:hypothetical protein
MIAERCAAMTIHKEQKKKERGTFLSTVPIEIVNMDRDTVSSLGAKLRSANAEIEKLKARLLALEERVEELEEERA